MIRMCKVVFDRVYITAGGEVRLCSWNFVTVGNIFENTLYEIWHSEKANMVRKSFLEEKLCGCHEYECPYCIQGDNSIFCENIEEAQKIYDALPDTPSEIILAFDVRCNHICPHCRQTNFVPDKEYINGMKKIIEHIEPYFNNVKFFDINGGGEVFVCPEMMDMLSRFKTENKDCEVYLETNGAMFKDNWNKIKHLAEYKLTLSVTPNSFQRETYRYLAGRDDLDKFNESFELIKNLRAEGKVNKLRVTMVVQDSNFREIPEFIQNCLDHNADEIILRPIFMWFGINQDEWFIKNVQNPGHPYHKEYMEILEMPICKHEKVYNWGITNEMHPVTYREYFTQILDANVKYVKGCIEEIRKAIGKNKVVVYGNGGIGKVLVKELLDVDNKADVVCIAVTNTNAEDEFYYGNRIRKVKEIEFDDATKIVLATNIDEYAKQMWNTCKELGILDDNIILMDGVCL